MDVSGSCSGVSWMLDSHHQESMSILFPADVSREQLHPSSCVATACIVANVTPLSLHKWMCVVGGGCSNLEGFFAALAQIDYLSWTAYIHQPMRRGKRGTFSTTALEILLLPECRLVSLACENEENAWAKIFGERLRTRHEQVRSGSKGQPPLPDRFPPASTSKSCQHMPAIPVSTRDPPVRLCALLGLAMVNNTLFGAGNASSLQRVLPSPQAGSQSTLTTVESLERAML